MKGHATSVHREHDDEHDASAEALPKAEDEHLVADLGVSPVERLRRYLSRTLRRAVPLWSASLRSSGANGRG